MRNSCPNNAPLYRIHERALDLVEDDNAEDQQDGHEGEAVANGCPGEVTLAEGNVFEGFDDGSHRVGHDEHAQVTVRHHAERIDNRSAIHPELDDKGEENAQVPVFGGHRRYQDAEAQA